MSRTYLTLCQRTAVECNITGRGPATVINQVGKLADIINAVADADMEIQGMWASWNFLWTEFAATLNVGDAAVPDIDTAVVKQWDRSSFWLDYSTSSAQKIESVTDWKTYRDEVGYGAKTNSTPQLIAVKPNRSLVVDPPPSTAHAFTAEYWKRPVRMTANDSTSPIAEEYDRIIIARAKLIFAATYGAASIVGDAGAEYNTLMPMLEADELPSQEYRALSQPEEIVIRPN